MVFCSEALRDIIIVECDENTYGFECKQKCGHCRKNCNNVNGVCNVCEDDYIGTYCNERKKIS